jgi:eukaryotic translation initiation factor 2C|tara:strand:- start:101 stop:766 length:666 start_codon:yes stop_codon:yes gene_type:complete
MIRQTATPPSDRRAAIEQTVREHVALQTAQHRVGFGINVSKEMTQVRGRVLKPPVVVYKNGKVAQPTRGAWNLAENVLLEPPPAAALRKWALVTLDSTVPDAALFDLSEMLRNGMRRFGGFLDPGQALLDGPKRQDEPCEDVVRRAHRNGAQLIVCVLPTFDNVRVYNSIKTFAELEIGVQTQARVARFPNPADCSARLLRLFAHTHYERLTLFVHNRSVW